MCFVLTRLLKANIVNCFILIDDYIFLPFVVVYYLCFKKRAQRQGSTCPFETYQCVRGKMFSLMAKLLNIYFGCPWQEFDFEKMSMTSYHGYDPCSKNIEC